MWIFVPPGAEWDIGEICAARGRMGICGNLCRQGPNYLETYDPEGVKEDFGRNCAARGLKGILGKSTLKGSHVYRIYAARGLMGICGYLCRQGPNGDFGEIDPEGVACLYEKGRLSF